MGRTKTKEDKGLTRDIKKFILGRQFLIQQATKEKASLNFMTFPGDYREFVKTQLRYDQYIMDCRKDIIFASKMGKLPNMTVENFSFKGIN